MDMITLENAAAVGKADRAALAIPAVTEPGKPSLLNSILDNGHQNISGLCGLVCAIGAIWGPPELGPKFAATAVAFGAYFAGHSNGSKAAN